MSLAAKLRQRLNALKRNMLRKRKEVSTPDDELYIAITEEYLIAVCRSVISVFQLYRGCQFY